MNNIDTNWPRLVADIGGTNARFALETAPQVLQHTDVLAANDYDSIVEAIRTSAMPPSPLPIRLWATGCR